MTEKQKIMGWLKRQDPEFDPSEYFFNPTSLEGPDEVAINDDGSWELSYESRTDETCATGKGLEELKRHFRVR